MNHRSIAGMAWQSLQSLGKKWTRRATFWDLGRDKVEDHCRIIVANSRETRERAYRLAYRVYREKGYVADSDSGMLVSPYDAQPETLTLLAEDPHGQEMGTVSLAFDSAAGLPSGEIYPSELNKLRTQDRRLAEVFRLAVDKSHPHSLMLLIRMFNFLSIFSRRVRKDTDFIIEVNPHHVAFYRRMVLFEQAGPLRACPRVNGAPAILLRMNLSLMDNEIRAHGHLIQSSVKRRNVYAQTYTWEEEKPIAKFLARQHKPMTSIEMAYFGLGKRNKSSRSDTMKLIMGAVMEESFGTLQSSLKVQQLKLA
jgi:hypothetical protein